MEYIIPVVVVAIFAGVVFILAKKENDATKEMVSKLTEEQKAMLEDNQVENFDYKKHTWTQRGMVAFVKEKGDKKVALKVLWYNTVIQNNFLNQCQHADITMKKADFEEKGLRVGSFVTIFIDPEKGAKIL